MTYQMDDTSSDLAMNMLHAGHGPRLAVQAAIESEIALGRLAVVLHKAVPAAAMMDGLKVTMVAPTVDAPKSKLTDSSDAS